MNAMMNLVKPNTETGKTYENNMFGFACTNSHYELVADLYDMKLKNNRRLLC